MDRWGWIACALVSVLGLAVAAPADVLELRSGERLEGRLLEAGADDLLFETDQGVHSVPRAKAAALHFGDGQAPAPAEASAATAPAMAPTAGAPAKPVAPAAAPAPLPRRVQLSAGSRLRVRVADTLDPRQVTEGDRFSALLETPLVVGPHTVVPARSVVYGVVTAASLTGPPSTRLELELVELQLAGQPIAIVTGTQERLDAQAPPAAQAPTVGDAKVPSGSLLEFRLLQPVELNLQPR